MCVCKDWERLIEQSYLFQRSKLRCCILHTTFEEEVLGLGIIIEDDGEGQVTNVTSKLEYFSYNAWANHAQRKGPSGQASTNFLPIIINNQHAHRAVPVFKELLGTYLPDDSDSLDATQENILRVLTILMNGAIVTLSSDEEEVSPELIQNQLELYCHLHHMLLFLNYGHGEPLSMTKLVEHQIGKALEDPKLLEKSHTYDVGTFLLKTGITDKFSWKSVRKIVLLELFDRDVPKYLRRYPELEMVTEGENPEDRLNKVLDCTVLDRRKIMIQTFFTCSVNRKHEDPVKQLEEYNRRYGSPDNTVIDSTAKKLGEIYAARDWAGYFGNLFLKPQDDNFVNNILVESMKRAEDKRYFEPNYQNQAQYAEPIPLPEDTTQPQEYESQPTPQRKKVSTFAELVDPLAACLKDHCEPLPLQKEALPAITCGGEAIIVSPHGTGKHTLAAISVIHTLLSSREAGSHVWVLVSEDCHGRHFEEILRDVYVAVPENELNGVPKLPVNVVLAKNAGAIRKSSTPCVYIGTPYQISDYLKKNYISSDNLQAVYILEADLMLTAHIKGILTIFYQVPQGIQCVLMTSSYNPTIEEQLPQIMGEPVVIRKTEYATRFRHWYVACIRESYKNKMFDLLCRTMKFTQAIVWVSNGSRGDKLKNTVANDDSIGLLTQMTRHQQRRDIVEQFNEGNIRILIITDDLSPYGIKTAKVDCLIHFDLPQNPKSLEKPIEGYERRLSTLQSSERVIESISFSLRNKLAETFLDGVKDKFGGLNELPADPNDLVES